MKAKPSTSMSGFLCVMFGRLFLVMTEGDAVRQHISYTTGDVSEKMSDTSTMKSVSRVQ